MNLPVKWIIAFFALLGIGLTGVTLHRDFQQVEAVFAEKARKLENETYELQSSVKRLSTFQYRLQEVQDEIANLEKGLYRDEAKLKKHLKRLRFRDIRFSKGPKEDYWRVIRVQFSRVEFSASRLYQIKNWYYRTPINFQLETQLKKTQQMGLLFIPLPDDRIPQITNLPASLHPEILDMGVYGSLPFYKSRLTNLQHEIRKHQAEVLRLRGVINSVPIEKYKRKRMDLRAKTAQWKEKRTH